jgi:lantibiotic biosynthesis protein
MPCTLLDDLATRASSSLDTAIRGYLKDPDIREAIYLASPSFFARILEWEEGRGDFNEMPMAIARYLLRMAFRATPFGTFSCVSPCTVNGKDTRMSLPSRNEMKKLVQLDAAVVGKLAQSILKSDQYRETIVFTVNDTLFEKDDGFVFTAYDYDTANGRVYKRVEVERTTYLDQLLGIAKDGKTLNQLTSELDALFHGELSVEHVEDFIESAVEAQILCADHLFNITIEDPLQGLIDCIPRDAPLGQSMSAIKEKFVQIDNDCGASSIDVYEDMKRTLVRSGIDTSLKSVVKADLYCSDTDNVIDKEVMQDLENFTNRFVHLSRRWSPLRDFSKKFTERFGDSEVPLVDIADQLDSLGFIHRYGVSSYLVRQIRPYKSSHSTSQSWGRMEDELLSVLAAKGDHQYVDITDTVNGWDIHNEVPGTSDATVVAWISLWKSGSGCKQPVLEVRSIGAQEPGRLMGRFAYGLPEVASYLRECAASENELVAEIVHLPDEKLGNVSARPMTSSYEITLRSGASRDGRRISLTDIMVSVRHGRVFLRSLTLDRSLTLRMSNAHAFDQQKCLPIYRFLNQVVLQDYVAEPLNLRKRLPKATFLPGLKYEGIVLSRPTWLIRAEDISVTKKSSRAEKIQRLKSFCNESTMPKWVAFSEGDNVMPCCLDTDWMLDELLKILLKKGSVLLTDVFPENMLPYLKSSLGDHFHEIHVALRAKGRTERSSTYIPTKHPDAVVPVWDTWSYFKLYAPPNRQNEILSELDPVLRQLSLDSEIGSFFFVRYVDDDGHHLRLRLEVPQGFAVETAMKHLRAPLMQMSSRGSISMVQIAPYVRESSRYGGTERSKICEKIFCLDSQFAITFSSDIHKHAPNLWRYAAMAVDDLLISFGLTTVDERIEFAQKASNDFSEELRFSVRERQRLGDIHRRSSPSLENGRLMYRDLSPSNAPLMHADAIRKLWREVLSAGPSLSDAHLYRIQWSLIHMRINRLLVDDHRFQEGAIWELLKRAYVKLKHQGRPEKLGLL